MFTHPNPNVNVPLATPLPADPVAVDIKPPKMPAILLMGEQGSGKTYAIRSLLDAGIEKVVVLALEPGIADNLGDISPKKLAWQHIDTFDTPLEKKAESARKIASMSFKENAATPSVDRHNYIHYQKILEAMTNIVCDRTGEKLGHIKDFPANWAFVIDSLSGLNHASLTFTVGAKNNLQMNDYMQAQQQVLSATNSVISSRNCLFVMTAHITRQLDENTQQQTLTVDTPGRAIAGVIGRYFSDVILAYKSENRYLWSTQRENTICKSRNLSGEAAASPTFFKLLNNFRNKQAQGKAD